MSDEPRLLLACDTCSTTAYASLSEASEVAVNGLHADLRPHEDHDVRVLHDDLGLRDLPVTTLDEAELFAELYRRVGSAQWPAMIAWVADGSYSTDGDGLPDASDFEDAYCGEFDDFYDYACQLAEDIDLLGPVPEELQAYFDMRAWALDVSYDYHVLGAPSGGKFIFRSL